MRNNKDTLSRMFFQKFLIDTRYLFCIWCILISIFSIYSIELFIRSYAKSPVSSYFNSDIFVHILTQYLLYTLRSLLRTNEIRTDNHLRVDTYHLFDKCWRGKLCKSCFTQWSSYIFTRFIIFFVCLRSCILRVCYLQRMSHKPHLRSSIFPVIHLSIHLEEVEHVL